ncbi:beta strand repeat-containing protein, partial [Eionea flava]
ATLNIGITDTAPTAVADTRTVSEDDTGITGNVITGTNASADTLGADATDVTGVAAGNSGASEITTGVGGVGIDGTYGTLTIAADGTYTYVTNDAAQALADGESATDTFSYTIKDDDGDFSTTTFTLTVTGEEDLPTVTIPNDDSVGLNSDDIVVAENATTSGSFTINAIDGGLASITVGTTTISAAALAAASVGSPISVDGDSLGELEITGYNATTGVVSYTYDPTGTSQDHSSATNDSLTDSIGLVVTDGEGQTDTATLNIGITDTAPTAVADTRTVSEDDTGITGNVITGTNASADTLGEDTPVNVIGVAAGNSGAAEITTGVGSSITGTYGTLTIAADGSYTYQTNAAAQALADGSSATDTFSYTIEDADGDFSTTTFTLTVTGANDAPVNTVPATVSTDTSSTFAFDTTDTVSSTDIDDNLSSVQLTVTSGTINVGADIGGATITAGANGSSTITISGGTEQDIKDMLANLEYTSTATEEIVTLTTVSTDSLGLTDTDNTVINVVGPATTPTLASINPDSTGLLLTKYNTEDSINLSGTDPIAAENFPTLVTDASTLEATIENSGATATTISRKAGGIGKGLLEEIETSPISSDNVENLDGENTAQTISGLIFLEAGVQYSFSGFLDDVLHIELGGQTVVTSNATASTTGVFNTSTPDVTTGITTTPFTPTVDGYYTLEVYNGNVDSNGKVILNVLKDGVAEELNAQNFDLFANVDDLIAAGGRIGSFNSNEGGASNESTDGGYFGIDSGVNMVGKSGGGAISLALLPIQTTGSDVLISITISDIPAGVIISDGVNTFDNTPTGAEFGQTSLTFTPQSTLNSGWDLSSLSISGLTATNTFQIEATASSATGNDTATAMAAQPFTIGILPADFLTDSDNSETVDSIISGSITSDDNVITGSVGGDTLTATNQSAQVIHGGQGADIITGGDDNAASTSENGDNTLFGNSGNDIIDGKSGDDIIFGGTGSDVLTGGTGSDIFVWESADGDGSTDTVTDFTQGSGGDVIDLSGLLTNAYSDNIGNFVTQTVSGTTSTFTINSDGVLGDDLTIKIEGLTDDLATMIENGNLVVDKRIIIEGSSSNDNLVGGVADEVFFPRGADAGSTRDNITLGGGADKIVYEAADAANVEYDGASWNNEGMARIDGFTTGDTATNAEADVLDLSGILTGIFDPNSAQTVAEQFLPHLHFGQSLFGATVVLVDIDGTYDASERDPVSGINVGSSGSQNTFNGSIGTDLIFEIKGTNFSTAVDAYVGSSVTLNSENYLQALIDMGTIVLE